MTTQNSGMKMPSRPAPGLPVNPANMVTSLENSRDPFSPVNAVYAQLDRKKPPPRPPPPRLYSQVTNHQCNNTFGSNKKKQQKAAATAIVKPLPPASTIPVGTLIDLQSPPSSPPFPTKLKTSLSVGNISSYTNNTSFRSFIESGFEDDFNSILSSAATTPAFDPWSTNSDFTTPSSSKTPSPDLMLPLHLAKTEVKSKNLKQVSKNQIISKPTIICVPAMNKVKPNRPPPPSNSSLCNIKLDSACFDKEGSPPMPSVPPPPPPPEALKILTTGPVIPPRPFDSGVRSSAQQPYCIAQYDYDSTHSGDLDFKAGDIITLISEVNYEWLLGTHLNKEGIFPKCYVNVIIPLFDKNSSETIMTVIAVYPFVAETWDDLDLKEGDKIRVIRRIDGNWLLGECRGKRGQFPECFTQDITDLEV